MEVRGGSVATYDYPYFNLRLTSLEVEAEILRRAETRAVGGLVLEGPRAVTGVVRVSLPTTAPPSPHPSPGELTTLCSRASTP